MTEQHPITPPDELLDQWASEFWYTPAKIPDGSSSRYIAIKAAQWGADQELDACCDWLLGETEQSCINELRAARRPKPKSLAEEALGLLNEGPVSDLLDHEVDTIRRALEHLQELGGQANG